ncbi:hypothetical protein [Gordonia zhaorongruii]|uniref:hypothetical protein n=1 Tax=Gordonia zhaorongruii TaxID=2597659 RepID=UPI0010539A00|nr:hypothetical protein [Gordonia zhaorongruii]
MRDAEAERRAHDVFDPICDDLFRRPGVDLGPMFGVEGVRIRGKVFAFVSYDGTVVVKLPSARIDDLVDDGVGERMVMSGRAMREWMHADQTQTEYWPRLVEDALTYVDSITP